MGNQSQYTKKDLSGDTQPLTTQLQEDIPSTKLYQHINELPLSRFIECLVDNNLKALIISGVPHEDALNEAWANIYEQYVEAIGDNENKMYLLLYKEITKTAIDISLIDKLIEVLQTYRVKNFEDMLNGALKTNFKFDASKPEEYEKLLKRCQNRSKSININHNLKKLQLEAMQKKAEGKSQKPTKEHFSSVLNVLSKHNAYRVNAADITVYEYIDLIQLMNQFNSK